MAADRDWTEAEYTRFMQNGTWRSELELRRKDGTRVPVEVQASTVTLPGGTMYLSVLRDISERRALEQQRQDFIAMVAHDLKNPLTTMKGYAQLLQRRGVYSERNVATIVAQANRLERLIDDLRDVTRIDAGQLALDRMPVDLAALVRANVEESRALSEAHTIDLEAPDEPIIGLWDAGRLAQVIENLLSNAVKYSPNGGTIWVRVDGTEDQARLAVIDEGIGLSPEALARVFERFYRSETGVAANRKGLGLGLYISKALVEAHGGTIIAESLSPTGSAFRVTLPREPSASR